MRIWIAPLIAATSRAEGHVNVRSAIVKVDVGATWHAAASAMPTTFVLIPPSNVAAVEGLVFTVTVIGVPLGTPRRSRYASNMKGEELCGTVTLSLKETVTLLPEVVAEADGPKGAFE